MKERIQKLLAAAGVASRRNVEEMIRQGRVAVNGTVRIDLPILIDPQKDKITVDDEPIRLEGKQPGGERIYILMNKPKGVYTTNVAQGEQTRAIDLLPPDMPARVYPVGRLDSEAKGVLLLTNDGELTNQLTHPRYGINKTYRVVVDGSFEPATFDRLQKGIWLSDSKTGKGFKTGKLHMKVIRRARDKSILEITIREARDRQIRRMLAAVGHKVRDLTRVKMGTLTLDGLQPGDSRLLQPREVKALRKFVAAKQQPRNAGDADASEEQEAVEGIRRGLDDVKHGRTRPAREALDGIRKKYQIPERNKGA